MVRDSCERLADLILVRVAQRGQMAKIMMSTSYIAMVTFISPFLRGGIGAGYG